MEIRVQILEDHTTHFVDEKNNIITTVDPEELSARMIQFISMGLYVEVLELVLQMRKLKVREIEFALTSFGYKPNKV